MTTEMLRGTVAVRTIGTIYRGPGTVLNASHAEDSPVRLVCVLAHYLH